MVWFRQAQGVQYRGTSLEGQISPPWVVPRGGAEGPLAVRHGHKAQNGKRRLSAVSCPRREANSADTIAGAETTRNRWE